VTNHCRAVKGKGSLENLNEKEGRNGEDNFVRDKRESLIQITGLPAEQVCMRLLNVVHICVRVFLAVT
jgi:hypothetical protein